MTSLKSFNEMKCIWMESGFIEYKLCELNFDCENCPLDKAIKEKGRFYKSLLNGNAEQVSKDEISTPKKQQNKFSLNLPDDYFLSPNHVWVKIHKERTVRIGLDEFAQKFVRRYSSPQLPSFESTIVKNKPILWFIGTYGVIRFNSPVSGTVRAVNYDLKQNVVNFFNCNPFECWFLEVETNVNVDLTNDLIKQLEYKNFVKHEFQRVSEFILDKMSKSIVGETMRDGGEMLEDIDTILDDETYIELSKKLFTKTI